MSNQIWKWSANFELISLWVTAVKHVENRPEVDGEEHLKLKATVHGRLLVYIFGQFQNTLMGGYSGTYPDQGSFLHLRTCIFWEDLVLSADTSLVTIWHQSGSKVYFFPHIQPNYKKTDTSHLNEQKSTSTRPFVSFKRVPCTFSFLARFSEIHELLHAESQRTRTFSIWKDDCKRVYVICNSPLTFMTEGMLGLSSVLFVTTVAFLGVVSLVSSVFLRLFYGKTFSEPCSKVLCLHEQPSLKHLRGFRHLRNECCRLNHEKQIMFSATNFDRLVGVFPRNRWQRHTGCFITFLQAIQLVG